MKNTDSKKWNESTFYELIEVDPQASSREIHAAYMRAKQTYSPDSPALYTMFSPEEARELSKLIEEAFFTLSNQNRRQQYDLQLAQSGHPIFSNLLKDEKKSKTMTSLHPISINPEPSLVTSSKVPAGYGKTKFGVYKEDPEFEKQLQQPTFCNGEFLQKIRTYKNVSLEQLSEETRISKSYLSALEADRRDQLPAPVFIRGFVLQVARALIVSDKLADAYMKSIRKN
ncbi:MAG: helix-turn-helix domain-containing protein [Bdellovibrionales bacterium]|nr:helix-turn-helix domain-containing protein [Bdellovibrionales bacterium]